MAEASTLIERETGTPYGLPDAEAGPLDVSILIVTWNSERWIERCLRSIPGACEGLRYEVRIYDNASHDRTPELIGDAGARITHSPENVGFASATNKMLTASRGRYVFLLNPDCELAPRALTTLFSFLDEHPEVAAAAPLLEHESGHSQREFQLRRLPTLRTFAFEILLLHKLLPGNGAAAHYRYRDLDLSRPQRIEQPAAAALLVRRDVFEEVGPLDEQFSPAWFEDVDYCRRLALHGKEIYVVPGASVRHFGGASLEHLSFGGFIDVWYRNMWRYARKWLPRGEAEALRWVIILGMLLRCVAAVLGFAHPEVGRRDTLRAYVHVLRRAFERWEPQAPDREPARDGH